MKVHPILAGRKMTGVGHVISTVRKKKAKTVHAQLLSNSSGPNPKNGAISSLRVELSTLINLMKIILQRHA